MLIIQCVPHGTRDEGAASPDTDSPVQRSHEIILKGYVHPHGHMMAHAAVAAPVLAVVQR